MQTLNKELAECLKTLCLPMICKSYSQSAELARNENYSYEHYLLELVQAERDVRYNNRVIRYLRESKLPQEKNLAVFDRQRLPMKIDRQINVLL